MGSAGLESGYDVVNGGGVNCLRGTCVNGGLNLYCNSGSSIGNDPQEDLLEDADIEWLVEGVVLPAS
jgi:hypothetical protein